MDVLLHMAVTGKAIKPNFISMNSRYAPIRAG
jgi:hypothetical protein